MSEEQFWVNPPGLTHSAGGFRDKGDDILRLAKQIEKLTGTDLTNAAGGDRDGKSFVATYLQGAKQLHEGVKSWSDAVSGTGDQVASMAKMFGKVEDSTSKGATDIQTALAARHGARPRLQQIARIPEAAGSADHHGTTAQAQAAYHMEPRTPGQPATHRLQKAVEGRAQKPATATAQPLEPETALRQTVPGAAVNRPVDQSVRTGDVPLRPELLREPERPVDGTAPVPDTASGSMTLPRVEGVVVEGVVVEGVVEVPRDGTAVPGGIDVPDPGAMMAPQLWDGGSAVLPETMQTPLLPAEPARPAHEQHVD